MFKIGKVEIKNRVVSAPLAGVTDKAFRIVIKSFGCGLVFTEMISDMGLFYEQAKTKEIADISGEEKPIAVQIFGSDPEYMAKAALKVENMGADIIDINMGCPAPKIVKNGEGAALMLDLPRARRIIREVISVVQVPVTVKMRRGWDENNINYLELGAIAEEEGASAVTLHGRTRNQFYSGKADWESIKMLKKHLSVPVIGNGDIWKAEDALRMLESTGCDAVMIGRGAMGNPFIFREAVELIENGRVIPPPSWEEKVEVAIKHLELACYFKGEAVAVREMRKHLAWYIKGMRGAAKIREEINRLTSKEEIINLLKSLT
ncbi:tRNA dihydrouridine synthase DusB [Thermosyntropha sp.]|uniref:tRNA dihydrouridine synthase DusB n=1 Tax=Thermosyntropha sp. TaxID=2740820 RepID=UPI0025EBFCA3|nr:tRNA dihydrouridine synthase DusB [Thermosyntropha sp.]MBO8159740.1 tRNA dihydrouridine synthase DusB [Thermosyntropha sp.]